MLISNREINKVPKQVDKFKLGIIITTKSDLYTEISITEEEEGDDELLYSLTLHCSFVHILPT